jgi:hypothetical protein
MPAGAWPSTSRAAWVRLHPQTGVLHLGCIILHVRRDFSAKCHTHPLFLAYSDTMPLDAGYSHRIPKIRDSTRHLSLWLTFHDSVVCKAPMRGRSSVDHPRTRVARRACFPTSNAAHSEFNVSLFTVYLCSNSKSTSADDVAFLQVLQSVDSSAVLALPAPRHPHEHRILP